METMSWLAPPALPARPLPHHHAAVSSFYADLIAAVMRTMVSRFHSAASTPPLVDTKLDLGSATGADFPADDPIRGAGAVYGWIQGRGLEALAGHAQWLRAAGAEAELEGELRDMLAAVTQTVQQLRARNGGRMWFFMRPDGAPFELREGEGDGPPVPTDIDISAKPIGFADVFTAKGLFAAAVALGDQAVRADAVAYVERVTDAILQGPAGFENDQEPLDPKNP